MCVRVCVCLRSYRAYLFEVAVLAGALLSVLVVEYIQGRFSLLQLQRLDLCLQLIQLLLKVLTLLHILHPERTTEIRMTILHLGHTGRNKKVLSKLKNTIFFFFPFSVPQCFELVLP